MKHRVVESDLPSGALVGRYRESGGHVDCYTVEVPRAVDLSGLITAFYSSRAFRPERWLLGALLGKRANDSDVAALADGTATEFSAWSVEGRREDEILLCDYQGRTRSWLKVLPVPEGTRLHFGSAVVPAKSRTDKAGFTLLLGFHRIYSRVLLSGAVRKLALLS